MESIYTGGAFCKLKGRRKQTGDRTEKKEKGKKGDKLEGKSQVLLEGRGIIGCYSVVKAIVYVRKLVY